MTRPAVVVDASATLAALMDVGPAGAWAHALLARHPLAAPHHMPSEAAGALRQAVLAGATSQDAAALALTDLGDLRVDYYPFEPFAARAWALRAHVPSHAAWYLALAEELDAPLITLDRRLADVRGVRCDVLTPRES